MVNAKIVDSKSTAGKQADMSEMLLRMTPNAFFEVRGTIYMLDGHSTFKLNKNEAEQAKQFLERFLIAETNWAEQAENNKLPHSVAVGVFEHAASIAKSLRHSTEEVEKLLVRADHENIIAMIDLAMSPEKYPLLRVDIPKRFDVWASKVRK